MVAKLVSKPAHKRCRVNLRFTISVQAKGAMVLQRLFLFLFFKFLFGFCTHAPVKVLRSLRACPLLRREFCPPDHLVETSMEKIKKKFSWNQNTQKNGVFFTSVKSKFTIAYKIVACRI